MNVQPSTTARAAEQARQQRLATSYRTTTHIALSIGVVGDQVLVPFELRPSNITLMVIVDQNLPFLPITPQGIAHDPLATALNCDACAASAISIGASVNRVGQHVMKRVVDRRLPLDRAFAAPWYERRNEDVLLPEPKQDLADRLKFSKFAEDQRDPVLYASVGFFVNTVVISLHVADSNGQMKFAAPSLLAHGFDGPLTEDR
jgi:hypothetical protein